MPLPEPSCTAQELGAYDRERGQVPRRVEVIHALWGVGSYDEYKAGYYGRPLNIKPTNTERHQP
jgi:hypothetical protein